MISKYDKKYKWLIRNINGYQSHIIRIRAAVAAAGPYDKKNDKKYKWLIRNINGYYHIIRIRDAVSTAAMDVWYYMVRT